MATEMTLRDAAHHAGIPVRELLDRIDRGEVPARREGPELLVDVDQLEPAAR